MSVIGQDAEFQVNNFLPRSDLEQGQLPQAEGYDPSTPVDAAEFAKVGALALAHEDNRDNEVYRTWWDEETYEVHVESDLTLEDYQRITPEADWQLLVSYADKLKDKRVVFVNSTPNGGGVVMLRPPVVHLLRQFEVDAHWYAMKGKENEADEREPSPFDVTKRIHNISQRRYGDDVRLTEKDQALHWDWNARNAGVFAKDENFQQADIIYIDDPQPAPLKVLLKDAVKPDVAWIFRNHIDTHNGLMSDPTTPQGEVARYLLETCGISGVDAVIAHPVEQFIHPGMKEKTYFAPATTDPFDDLNRKLTPREIKSGINFINKEIAGKNVEFAEIGRRADRQPYVDPTKKRIVLVARFDESKGMDHAMALGVRVRQIMRESGFSEEILPQIVMVGNGAHDDPSGPTMFEEILRLRREQYPEEKDNIVIMRLKHNYLAMNALMHPSGEADGTDNAQVVGIQTSEAEGFETRITDWIHHGAPAVIFNNGGMPQQVEEGQSGYIMDYSKPGHDLERGARIIADLMMDPAKYTALRRSTHVMAEVYNDREFTTTANVTRIARAVTRTLAGLPADKQWKIGDLVHSEL